MSYWHPSTLPFNRFLESKRNSINTLNSLFELLTYVRPADSNHEAEFVEQLMNALPEQAYQDGFGNVIIDTCDNPKTLFCSHTDSISLNWRLHRQSIDISDLAAIKSLDQNPLGSDDGAGIWLMLNMINANIPGRYIFHRAEETGTHGSIYISEYTPELLTDIKLAVGFDRRGTDSLVTHMDNRRACSDEFAQKFTNALNMQHKLDSTGALTDAATYIGLIPQCTNISVGYSYQHSSAECLNVNYLLKLRDRVLQVKWSALS